MNPTQSSHVVFGPGGNDVPILTRASGQTTAGYQTMGLPGGNAPFPGGGANKTVLGAFRMGEDDGNGPGSAIYPGEIFPPIPPSSRVYPERTFENVGNNVFQPEKNDRALHELLRRLGDQKFKAETKAPFEDYLAQQRLARDVDEASRNASLSDLGASREIMRNMAEQRRQQNEDDYLRRMLDAGMTPEAARKEIEDVRNASALQEARKVEDRPYQAKMLITRLAASRGVTSMVREPLTQSAAIDNPDRSQAMAQAMGVAGGFGTAPLDANRQFLTADFYRKFLRRSTSTQEAADETSAFSQLIAQGKIPDAPAGSYSLATIKGQERQNQVEQYAESLAARLDSIKARQNRIKKPLPPNVFAKEILDKLYDEKNQKPGAEALFSLETISDMDSLQLLITLNLLTLSQRGGYGRLQTILAPIVFGTPEAPSPTLVADLRQAMIKFNFDEFNVEIPFASTRKTITPKKMVEALTQVKTEGSLRAKADSAGTAYSRMLGVWAELTDAKQAKAAADVAEGEASRLRNEPPRPTPFADLNPFAVPSRASPSRADLERSRKMMISAQQLGLAQVNFGPEPSAPPAPREMNYGASYGQQTVGKPPAQALFEAFDTRLAARDAVSGGRMSQTDKRNTPYVEAIKQAKANIKGGLAPKKNSPALPLMPIQEVYTPPAIPTRTALGRMSGGDIDKLMAGLRYPNQGTKATNVQYINARRK
jgi:hypothetical protein